MRLQSLFILTAVALALSFAAPVVAAPLAQASVDEVVVTSTNTFTLTVMLDEVTTLAIPLQVDWLAEGPNEGREDEVLVTISPTVLRQGMFSVTVGSVEPTIGSLAVTLAEPADEIVPITRTATTTGTSAVTATTTATPTVSVPTTNTTTANAVSNLRAGPGTDFAIVGSAQAGDALDVVGQNSDGTWFVLANGDWIAAFLVDNAPEDLPVVEPRATPLPSPAASDVLTPTVTPTP
jgi:hypothetical protein